MINYSVYTSDKSITNIKSPFLALSLTLVTLNYGFHCYYFQDSKNSMLILLFFLSLIMYWRSFTIQKSSLVPADKSLIIELKGGCIVYFMILLNFIKFATEVSFIVFDISHLFSGRGRVIQVISFLLNAEKKGEAKINLAIIFAYNLIEIILLLIVAKIQRSFTLRVFEEETIMLIKWYKVLETGLKMGVLVFLFFESFFGNSFYILVIYFLLREQIMASESHKKVSHSKYFANLRYIILLMFFVRDIFIVMCRIFIGDINLTNQLLSTFLEERFFRKTVFFCFCQLYIYCKNVKRTITKNINEEEYNHKIKEREFQRSNFMKVFLNNIMHIFKVQSFNTNKSYIDMSIKKVNECFESDHLIDKYIQELKKKKISHSYTVINQLVRKVGFLLKCRFL